MKSEKGWRERTAEIASRLRENGAVTSQRVASAVSSRLTATASVAGEAYTAALSWKDNSEFSKWIENSLSAKLDSSGKIVSRAMDAEYVRTHIGGNWHRIYDGRHTIAGSLKVARDSLPELSALDQLGAWADSYWNDLVTTRGMPIITLDHAHQVGQYFKHLDCANAAQLFGGEVYGVSIYCSWNDPAKLVASATATDCSAIVYANVVAPLVSLIAIGRAYYLLKKSEQDDVRLLFAPALKGLTRGATILLITVIPGGFLLHLSSGIVVGIATSYAWDKGTENKDAILAALKQSLGRLRAASPELRNLTFTPSIDPASQMDGDRGS